VTATNPMEVDIPEVTRMHQNARFYREGDRDLVEISCVGSKDTMVHRVKPHHMAMFRDEWNAYCDGVPLKPREGTALTDVPSLTEQMAQSYIGKNVHTAEELAALSDGQCQALGHGTLTLRNNARGLVEQRRVSKLEEASRKISKAAESVGSLSAAEAQAELDAKYASKADVDEIKGMLAQLLTQGEKRKPGRPKKEAE
jgi:hypothetical protein